MSRAGLALRALHLTLKRTKADPTPDYDAAGPTYDEYFTGLMGRHSVDMLDEIAIEPGATVIELACGTGHLTAEIARRLEGRGVLRVVDISAGMLAVARAKVPESDQLELTLTQGDMQEFLSSQPDAIADLVVIGWAICYTQPVRLLKEVLRVLRPTGQVAIIETRSDALQELKHAFESVVAQDPSMLMAMIDVALPKNAHTLSKWFTKAGLSCVVVREGEQELPCANGHQALEWVERSGAGAGFRDSFDASRQDEIRDRLRTVIDGMGDKGKPINLKHTFVVGVARRGPVDRVLSR